MHNKSLPEHVDEADVTVNTEPHYVNSVSYVHRELEALDYTHRDRLERKIEIYDVASDPTVFGIAMCLLRPGGIRDSLEVSIPVLEKLSDKIYAYRRKKLADKCLDLTLEANAAPSIASNIVNEPTDI